MLTVRLVPARCNFRVHRPANKCGGPAAYSVVPARGTCLLHWLALLLSSGPAATSRTAGKSPMRSCGSRLTTGSVPAGEQHARAKPAKKG